MRIKFDNSGVRRQDRLLDEQPALDLLYGSEYGVLSFVENRDSEIGAYGIPINYVWDRDGYIYFHCAPEGHKLDCLNISSEVCFTVIGRTEVISHKFTTAYQSVIIRGSLENGLSADERQLALQMLLEKYSPNHIEVGLKYIEKSLHRTEILRLKITHISAKAKQVDR